MALMARILAGGVGWRASDVLCRAGPADAPFEERHDLICTAVVLEGTFGYRSSRGAATLAPGAVLLGNLGDYFECGHTHSVGDRCLAFHFDPSFYESIVADVPGISRLIFDCAALPPNGAGAGLLSHADGVYDDPAAAEEFAYEIAAQVAVASRDGRFSAVRPRADTGRIQDVLHWIEKELHEPLSLSELARMACMSPYHFLREFRRVIGATPYQFVLSLRVRRAAKRLRQCDDPVLQIAMEAGFSDLSEFNRRFRRVLGVTPSQYRARPMATASPDA